MLRSGGDKGTSKGNRSSQRVGRNTEETVGSKRQKGIVWYERNQVCQMLFGSTDSEGRTKSWPLALAPHQSRGGAVGVNGWLKGNRGKRRISTV